MAPSRGQTRKQHKHHSREHFRINTASVSSSRNNRTIRKLVKTCNNTPIVPHISRNVLPGNDFYSFVNKKWTQHAHLQPYNTSIGVSEEIEQEINKKLQFMCDNAHNKYINKKPIHADEKVIGEIIESIYNNDNSLVTFKELLRSIHCIRSVEDVCKTMAEFMVYRINCPLILYSGPEDNDPKHWRLHISPGLFGLPDESYYNGKGPGGTRTFNAYIQMLTKLGSEFDCVPLDYFFHFESTHIKYIDNVNGVPSNTYTLQKLTAKYPHILWDVIIKHIAYITNKSEYKIRKTFNRVVVDSEEWLDIVNDMCDSDNNVDLWKALFQANLILHSIQYLPHPYNNYYFEFYSRRLKGITERLPKKMYALKIIQDWLTIPLSRLYIDHYTNNNLKKDIVHFAESLRSSTINRINESDWMDSTTRRIAKNKVMKMKMGLLYPDKSSSYISPELIPNNLLSNILSLGRSKTISEVKHINHFMTAKTWDDPVYAVNAYYYNQGNRLILPAGIVNWPFYCMGGHSIAWNYGGLGAVIGHEITHAFDMDGMQYNADGSLVMDNIWWTDNDIRQYKMKAKKIVDLFSKGTHFDHKVDGKLTLSENIADLGGLAIALDALKESQLQRKLSNIESMEELRMFFISYAVSWRIKERRKKAIQALFIDYHAPSPLRVNYIVSQFNEWYDAFNILPSNKLYIEPAKRIRIF